MNLSTACAVLLLLAVLLGGLRRLLAVRGMPPADRPALWRTLVLLVLPLVSAALLYLTLFPPARQAPVGQLTVLTAHAESLRQGSGPAIALPEAARAPGADPAPDLATALRQRPGVRELRVLGDGLNARDLPAAAGRSMRFEPAPAPTGLIEYWQQQHITPGMPWRLRGRVNGLPDAEVRLLDPAGQRVAQQRIAADGRFMLGDVARGPGLSEYSLQIRDAGGKRIESLTVPVAVEVPTALRLLGIAGAPNAEWKMLRRWALDVGAELDSRTQLAPGMATQSADFALTPARLRDSDLLLVDERGWQGLSAAERRAVQAAVRDGLGLLLRITGPLPAEVRADFAGFGLRIRDTAGATAVRLPEPGAKPRWPMLSRRPVQAQASAAQVLLEDGNGEPLALRRDVGQGRVGVLWLTDSYRLPLAGFAPAHARLWSALVSDLARANSRPSPEMPDGLLHPGWRAVFCGLREQARVLAPDATITTLVPMRMPGGGRCAGFWPQHSGWHRLQTEAGRQVFYVHSAAQGRALVRHAVQQATRQFAAVSKPAAGEGLVDVPGSPWPWFIGWLVATALLWWLERSRFGQLRSAPR